MARFLRCCIVCLVSLSPLAFSADRVIVVEPSQLQKTYTPGSGAYAFNDSRSWSEPVSVQNGRVNVPVVSDRKFTWASFRGGLKNALKLNPASILLNATVAGALAAVGWVLDPANNSIQRPASAPEPLPNTTYYSNASAALLGFVPSGSYSTAQAITAAWQEGICAVKCVYGPVTATYNIGSFSSGNSNPYELQIVITYKNSSGSNPSTAAKYAHLNGACVSPLVFDSAKGFCYDPSLTPKQAPSPAEWDSFGDSFVNPADAASIAPDIITAVPGSFDYPDGFDFSGPESLQGEPVTTTTTTPTSTTVSESTPTYTFDYSSNPNTITTTTTTTTNVYQDGNLILTENTTNAGTINPVQPEKLEIPTDCEFMPTVCAWLDWFKSPAPPPNDPQLPEITDSFEKSYSGPSLSATCPPPFTVNTGAFGTILMPVQPLCDLAGLIKYLVLSAAGLLAAFIISGTRRA